MKKIVLFAVLVLLVACHSEEVVKSHTKYVTGEIFYKDLLTEKAVTDQSKIGIYFRAADNSDIPKVFADTLKGFTFRFGPLNGDKSYIIKARYVDTASGIEYEASKEIKPTDEKIKIELLPVNNFSTLIGSVIYTDILEDKVIDNQLSIKTKLKRKDGLLINGKEELICDGSTFRFPALDPNQKYLIESLFVDPVNKVRYVYHKEIANLDRLIIKLAPSGNSIVLQGMSSYTDELGKATSFAAAEITLTRKDGLLINGQQKLTMMGPMYRFIELSKNIEYLLSSKFTDPNTKFQYNIEVTAGSLDSTKVNKKDLTLLWKPVTAALVKVVDPNGIPVPGAQVFTYNNYSLLLKYKSNADASIHEGTTNNKGEVLFVDLNAEKHFFFGLKVIGDDSLNTLEPTFDPGTVGALNENQINTSTVKLKF